MKKTFKTLGSILGFLGCWGNISLQAMELMPYYASGNCSGERVKFSFKTEPCHPELFTSELLNIMPLSSWDEKKIFDSLREENPDFSHISKKYGVEIVVWSAKMPASLKSLQKKNKGRNRQIIAKRIFSCSYPKGVLHLLLEGRQKYKVHHETPLGRFLGYPSKTVELNTFSRLSCNERSFYKQNKKILRNQLPSLSDYFSLSTFVMMCSLGLGTILQEPVLGLISSSWETVFEGHKNPSFFGEEEKDLVYVQFCTYFFLVTMLWPLIVRPDFSANEDYKYFVTNQRFLSSKIKKIERDLKKAS